MGVSLKNLQKFCLGRNLAFVSYIIPGEKTPVSLFPESSHLGIYENIDNINSTSGFLFAPFQNENCPVIVIPDSFKVKGWEINEELFNKISTYSSAKQVKLGQLQKESTFSEYSAQIDTIKQNLIEGKTKKVVLSRIKELHDIEIEQLPKIFEEMSILYPHAFVYLISTPESGTWIGATPEMLINIEHSNFSTMALAATKKFVDENFQETWNDKEFKEHEYVAKFIRNKLSGAGYKYSEQEKQSIRAGNVIHLRTIFSGKLTEHQFAWKDFINLLYPTPAIFGTGDEAVLHLIQEVEKHKREYYTGIIGPFSNNEETSLFINLRCMKVFENSAILFAGGGILNESSTLKEWEETELKFDTLIQVIQKIRNSEFKKRETG